MIRYSGIKRIHFIGIGGEGMCGIAQVLHNMGFNITGSDISDNSNVKDLKSKGIKIDIGHNRGNIKNIDTVVYSSAVTDDNLELDEARKQKIPVIPRAEMLAELMRLKYAICVAGTHGKTTTTSMIATILTISGMDPTYVVGGKLMIGESGAKLGKSDYLVAEADESDGSFLSLYSTVAVITNIEDDHLDYYKTMENLKETFCKFANKVPFYGSVILNRGCNISRGLIPKINKKAITFGFDKESDIQAVNIKKHLFETEFDLVSNGKNLGRIKLFIGGEHNIQNALAACTLCLYLGVSFEDIKEGLKRFYLPKRRFQILYQNQKNIVIDDYAHHPKEVFVTLSLLKGGNFSRIITIFQPHRYTRLKLLMDDFSKAFLNTEELIITKVYSANQKPIRGITGQKLVERIGHNQEFKSRYIEKFEDIISYLEGIRKEGDAFIFLSAGDLTLVANEYAKVLENTKE